MDKQAVRITLRLPAELHAKLLESARNNDRSLNGQIVHLLRLILQQQGQQA